MTSTHAQRPKRRTFVVCEDAQGREVAAFFRNACIFSNFHASPIQVGALHFHCSEQFFMHQKALIFGDLAVAQKILEEPVPQKIKALGRRVRNFNDQQWLPLSVLAMTVGSLLKYKQNDAMREELFATGSVLIVEASPYDRRWGAGIGLEDLRDKKRNWTGLNLLGRILTSVREALKQGSEGDGTADQGQRPDDETIAEKLHLSAEQQPAGVAALFSLTSARALEIAAQLVEQLHQ